MVWFGLVWLVWKKSQRASGAHQHCILCCFLLYHNLPLSTPLFGKTDNAQSERKRGGLCLNFCSAGCRAIVFVGQEERITSPPFSFLLPSPFFFFPFGICSSLFVRSRGILLHMESSACSSLRLPTLVLLFVHGKQTLTKIFPLVKGRTHCIPALPVAGVELADPKGHSLKPHTSAL